MRMYRTILMIFAAFCFTSLLFANSPFSTDEDAYHFGYEEGYRHGLADREMEFDFDFTHSHRFQSGINYDSYDDGSFRDGYAKGYADAYYAKRYTQSPSFSRRSNFDAGFVTVFTKDGFRGEARQFAIGSYADLDGDWDDSISSIQIDGPVRVVLFDEEGLRGRQLIIEQDIAELGELNFDSKAESMIVEPIR